LFENIVRKCVTNKGITFAVTEHKDWSKHYKSTVECYLYGSAAGHCS
jgi:hypothetical protein